MSTLIVRVGDRVIHCWKEGTNIYTDITVSQEELDVIISMFQEAEFTHG
jgi:hypothetical protein